LENEWYSKPRTNHNKSQVTKGETFDMYLKLSKSGNYTVNVWKLEERVSYDISFYYSNGYEVPYICGVNQRPRLTNEYLVELHPGEFIESTFSHPCWDLKKGEYTLSAVYHTSTGEA